MLFLVLAMWFLTFSISVKAHAALMTVPLMTPHDSLQVLSYNLCTVMKIPLDPVTLEQHFKEDSKGPLSNQGYMPYLNTFILDKVGSHSSFLLSRLFHIAHKEVFHIDSWSHQGQHCTAWNGCTSLPNGH